MERRIVIHYSTRDIPAPYAFGIKAVLDIGQDMSVKFDLEYTGREELDEDDILDEGFSGKDDIHWAGTLPAVWIASLDDLLSKTTWASKPNRRAHCSVKVQADASVAKIPSQPETWEYWLQELQQACMEAAKLEKSLEIRWVKGSREISLNASFTERQASAELNSPEDKKQQKVPWQSLRKILKHVYIAEFSPEEAISNYDNKGDIFLNPGSGQWFNITKGNLFLEKKPEWLSKLETLFNELVTGP